MIIAVLLDLSPAVFVLRLPLDTLTFLIHCNSSSHVKQAIPPVRKDFGKEIMLVERDAVGVQPLFDGSPTPRFYELVVG
jgi:hypothetical protein